MGMPRQGEHMPYYVTLGQWTEQGVKNVKDLSKRAAASRALVEKSGGKLISALVTMGRYDFVFVSELPNDEAAMGIALTIGSQGNARTTTLKGWTVEDAAKVVAKIP
jgi:uncharacterized protein with GYD domain